MKIAIQGHSTRGEEVIQILESLGGKNKYELEGYCKTFYYINDENEIWDTLKKNFLSTYKLYTLEEFEKEFPFKVGDLCIYYSDILDKDIVVRILGMTIKNNCIMYEVGHRSITNYYHIYRKRETLRPYKEMDTRNITLTLDKAKEWYKKGGELREIALQAFSEKELNTLPRSWEEYCRKYGYVCLSTRYTNLSLKYDALIKLEQLRDCWRQSWKPKKNKPIYAIKFSVQGLGVYNFVSREFLSFPTREMAEEFLECFKDLINEAGDLI